MSWFYSWFGNWFGSWFGDAGAGPVQPVVSVIAARVEVEDIASASIVDEILISARIGD